MTTFYILSAVMVLITLLFVARPFLSGEGAKGEGSKINRIAGLLVILLLPAAAAFFYQQFSTWDWDYRPGAVAQANQDDPHAGSGDNISGMIGQLKARLDAEGGSADEWVLLGRSYTRMGDKAAATRAFEKAVELGADQDPKALVQMGQALVEMDESSLAGGAGELFEKALRLSPDDPGALWWSGYGSLAAGRLEQARDRWTRLLELGPPENIVDILNQQIAGINQELGVAATPAVAQAPVATPGMEIPEGSVAVSVSLDPALDLSALDGATPVFIIAREAQSAGGPPIAVIRKTAGELPLTIVLSDANAMIPGTSITGIEQLKLTARISSTGRPMASPGDLYGEIEYRWEQGNQVRLVIDKLVK